MRNRHELAQARRKAENAANELAWIEALPRRKGSVIRWSNGVIWRREGDDDWRAAYFPDERYSSSHIASGEWVRVDASEWVAALATDADGGGSDAH